MIKKILASGIERKTLHQHAPEGIYFEFEGFNFVYIPLTNTIHKVLMVHGITLYTPHREIYRTEPTISTDSYTIYGTDEIAFAPVVQRLFNLIIS